MNATGPRRGAGWALRGDGPVIAFVGQIKAYKNIPSLIRAFLDAAHPRAILLIAGRPVGPDIEAELRALTKNEPRILCRFGLIPDDRMQLYLNSCDLAVFPYREILNSGSAILSLSFNRPALVPARGAMGELRELAGPDWIYTYEEELSGGMLSAALDWAVGNSRPARCELSSLSWQAVAAGTLACYCDATGHGTPTAYGERVPA